MEETQIKTLETLQKISPRQFNLRISNTGEVDIKGDIKGEDLQVILDSSHLRNKLYLEHQKHLDHESNLVVCYIGLIFSTLVGLTCFCLLNQSPKNHTYQSLGVINYVDHG
jgi:hypothetical protein